MILWLIGLSGAGKTTVGRIVAERLRETRPNIVFIDGDDFRRIAGDDLGHTLDDRRRNSDRLINFSLFLERQGIDVVAAVLSIFPDSRAELRRKASRYIEVFLDAPLELLRERDEKGLYAAPPEGGEPVDVVGLDIPFPRPEKADLRLPVERNVSPHELASAIIDHLRRAE